MNTHLRQFWAFAKVTLPYWDKILLSFIVNNFIEMGMLLPPLILRVLFDYVYPFKDIQMLITFSLLPLVLTIILNLLSILRSFTDLYVNQNVFRKLYAQFYSKLQRLPLRFFQEYQPGDLIYRMTDDIQVIENTVLSTIPTLFSSIFKLAVLLIICFSMNMSLTLIALLGVPLHFWQTHYFSKKLRKVNQESQEINSSLFDLLEERLSNIKLIKLFHTWSVEVDQLLRQVTSLFHIERKQKLTDSSYTIISTIINRTWVMVLGLYTGYCLIHGYLTIGEVVAITSYIAMLQSPFDNIAAMYNQFVVSSVSFSRITEILSHPAEYQEEEGGLTPDIKGQIEFQNISFGYDAHRSILKNISFEVPQGSSVAIVGKSGIGKSSIIDLLLGFYSLNEGKIFIDGVDINTIKLPYLRQKIGLISQDTGLFNGSVLDNIMFGSESGVTQEDIIEASKMADAHDFIMELPYGYNSSVGPKGSALSSGQRQKIAIARALLKKPKIIIFDEATTSLDGESEKQIQKTLEKLSENTTVIVIAHRLSSIKTVDQIVVIGNDGSIAETGPVAELMDKKGLFYKLYELQFGGFQQYVHQLQFLLKTLRRYDRPVSIAALQVNEFEKIQAQLNQKELDQWIDDVRLTISLFLREVDYVSYEIDGRFWIAFPETPFEGAQMACKRLKIHLDETCISSTLPLHLRWVCKQCDKTDDLDTLLEYMSQALEVSHAG